MGRSHSAVFSSCAQKALTEHDHHCGSPGPCQRCGLCSQGVRREKNTIADVGGEVPVVEGEEDVKVRTRTSSRYSISKPGWRLEVLRGIILLGSREIDR